MCAPDIQCRRGELVALVAHGVFRVRNVTLVAVRVAKVLAEP